MIPHRQYSLQAAPLGCTNRCDPGTDSIVWMREGVYGIVTMLFFDACTLEGKSFRVFYFYQKERFFL